MVKVNEMLSATNISTKKNYNYGKIVFTNPNMLGIADLEYAPKQLVIGTRVYTNPTPARYLSQGWKQIIWGEIPADLEDGVPYDVVYTEDETHVFGNWVAKEN